MKVAVALTLGKVAPVDLCRGSWVLNKECAAVRSGGLNVQCWGDGLLCRDTGQWPADEDVIYVLTTECGE